MRQLAECFTECANQPEVPSLRVPTPTRKLLPLGPKLLNHPLCHPALPIRETEGRKDRLYNLIRQAGHCPHEAQFSNTIRVTAAKPCDLQLPSLMSGYPVPL